MALVDDGNPACSYLLWGEGGGAVPIVRDRVGQLSIKV